MTTGVAKKVIVVAIFLVIAFGIIFLALSLKNSNKKSHTEATVDVVSVLKEARAKEFNREHQSAINLLTPVVTKVHGRDLADIELAIGTSYINMRDYKNALIAFQAADKAYPSYGTSHAVADAASRIPNKALAIEAYRKCLVYIKNGKAGVNAQEEPDIRKTIIELGGTP